MCVLQDFDNTSHDVKTLYHDGKEINRELWVVINIDILGIGDV